jgi:hypothetical protein
VALPSVWATEGRRIMMVVGKIAIAEYDYSRSRKMLFRFLNEGPGITGSMHTFSTVIP